MRNPEVLITAGGTQEFIDDVRYIGNLSGGRLGVALANAYAMTGVSVTLLAPNSATERFKVHESVQHLPFKTTAELDENLNFIESAGIIYQAAAIADYTPVRASGKIDSSHDTLTITMQRNKKILPTLRQRFGEGTTIVGFKLLSGVKEDQLAAAALKQITTAQTDYCVANDLQHLGTRRKVTLYANGAQDGIEIVGSSKDVAKALRKHVQKRV